MKFDDIIEKLTSFGVNPLIVLHREKNAGLGDYHDDEWNAVYDYALIVRDEARLHDKENLSEWYAWCDDNHIDCLVFDQEGCINGVDALIDEMKARDGAVVVKDLREAS